MTTGFEVPCQRPHSSAREGRNVDGRRTRLDGHEDRPGRCPGSARRPRRSGPPVPCRNARMTQTSAGIGMLNSKSDPARLFAIGANETRVQRRSFPEPQPGAGEFLADFPAVPSFRRTYCCNGSLGGASVSVSSASFVLSMAAGSGPRPSAKAASSTRLPCKSPGSP
jgi:hypothetical protein